jgi:hypothetical protein
MDSLPESHERDSGGRIDFTSHGTAQAFLESCEQPGFLSFADQPYQR